MEGTLRVTAPDGPTGRSRPVSAVEVANVVLVAVPCALPALVWGRVFADSGHLLPMVVAAAGGAGLALAGCWWRLRPSRSAASLLGALLVGLALRQVGDLDDFADDLVNSWKSLASTGLLIPTSAPFLIPPTVVTALASWSAATLALRRRAPILAVLPIATATAVALAYTVSQGGLAPWYVATIVGCLGAFLALEGLRAPGGTPFGSGSGYHAPGQVAVAVGLVALLVVGSWAGSTVAGSDGDEPFDLRARLVRPVEVFEAATPLATVKSGLVADAPDVVFTVALEGLPADATVSRLVVATLDGYDGNIWTTTASFEPAGARLPSPTQASESAGLMTSEVEVTQTVEIEPGYPFRFLPRVGTVKRLFTDGLAWDPRAGTMAAADADLERFSAAVELERPRPDPVPDVGDIPAALRYASQVPELTDAQFGILADYVNEVASTGATTVEQLSLIEADLRSDSFGYNEDAAAGHSLAALTSYLRPTAGAPDGGAAEVTPRVGFAEQSAAVFALIARQLGVPSRVVVGYRLDNPLTAAEPEQTAREDGIHAWPEIWIGGVGWVAFEPTNPANDTDQPSSRTPTLSPAGGPASRLDLPELQQPVLLPPDDESGGRSWLWLLMALPLVAFVYTALVVGAKRLRRARRRAGEPASRILGAWHELRDRLEELGQSRGRSTSALDLAERLEVAGLEDASAAVTRLAPSIDDALYAPSPPSRQQADEAWMLGRHAIGQVRRRAGARRRVVAALDVRTLFHR